MLSRPSSPVTEAWWATESTARGHDRGGRFVRASGKAPSRASASTRRRPPHAADHRARRFGDEHLYPPRTMAALVTNVRPVADAYAASSAVPGGARGRQGGARAARVVAERRVGTSSPAIAGARRARGEGVALGAARAVGPAGFPETAVDTRRVGAGARASDAARAMRPAARAMRPADRGEAQRSRAASAAGDASGQVRLPLAHPKSE